MQFNIEITPATIEALAKGISYVLDALGNHPGGILMLVLVILSIGVAGALFHMQLKLTDARHYLRGGRRHQVEQCQRARPAAGQGR